MEYTNNHTINGDILMYQLFTWCIQILKEAIFHDWRVQDISANRYVELVNTINFYVTSHVLVIVQLWHICPLIIM